MTNQPGKQPKTMPKERDPIFKLAFAIIYSYMITILIFIIFSIILTFTMFPEKYIYSVVTITSIISIIIAGCLSARNCKSNGWLYGSIAGLSYICILFIISSTIFKNFMISKNMLLMTGIAIITGAFGGIVGINMKSSKKK